MGWIIELIVWLFIDIIIHSIIGVFSYLMSEHTMVLLFGVLAIGLTMFGLLIAIFLNDRLPQYVLMSVAIFVGTLIVVMVYQGISALRKHPQEY